MLLNSLFVRAERKRGIIDRIKYDGPSAVLAWKYPYEDIRLGAQLVVNESQFAILVREGRHLATMGPGRHTLSTANIPILAKLVNLPFGGDSPFTAEVWFFNLAANLNVKFGTPTPIYIHEPKYNVIVPVRAHGQMGLRLSDCRKFLREIVGTMGEMTTASVYESFRGMVVTKLKTLIAETVVSQKISLLEVSTLLDSLSKRCHDSIASEFERFGLSVVNLFIEDISFLEDDPIVQRLRSTVMDRSEFEILGDARYQAKRSLDVMENAANNHGGIGSLFSAGLGLGLGAGVGAQSASLGSILKQPSTLLPHVQSKSDLSSRLLQLRGLLQQGLIDQFDFDRQKQEILNEI